MSCAKTAEPIEVLFGIWTHVGPRKHVLGGAQTSATWRIPLNRPRTCRRRCHLLSSYLDHCKNEGSRSRQWIPIWCLWSKHG